MEPRPPILVAFDPIRNLGSITLVLLVYPFVPQYTFQALTITKIQILQKTPHNIPIAMTPKRNKRKARKNIIIRNVTTLKYNKMQITSL